MKLNETKLQNLITDIVKEGKSVSFQKWNDQIRICITSSDDGVMRTVEEKFPNPALVPLDQLLEVVRRKLNEQGMS